MDIREFKNIYKEYAPSIVWDWCAKPSAEEIDAKLSLFSQMGISCIYIRPSKGLVLPYLSEDYFELIRTAARRSGKYGIKLFICDENSPASGNGGGEITSVSDYRLRDFVKADRKDIEKFDEIISENSGGALVLRDMSKVRASSRAPLADITDAFVTECFIDAVYNKYIRQCKRFLGIEIAGFLTNIEIPEGSLIYSPAALKNSEELTPAQCAQKLINKDSGFIKEYFSSVSECVAENFTLFLKEKCAENELLLSVSVNGEKQISRQLQYLKSDIISLCTDTQAPDYVQLKLAQSISEQFEKPFYIHLLLPSFAPCSERYNAAAAMAVFGAEGIVYDSVPFSVSDRRKYEKHTVSVSEFAEKAISERLSRLCFAAANTRDNAKLLVVCDMHDQKRFSDIAQRLLEEGIPFHMADEAAFEKLAIDSGDYVTVGKCEYTSLIIPDKEYALLQSFKGNIFIADTDIDYESLTCKNAFNIISDKKVVINRRMNDGDEYIFVTARHEDTVITAQSCEGELLAADCSNGELYSVPQTDGRYSFTLKAGKTAMLISSEKLVADIAPPFTDDIEFTPYSKECDVPFALSAADENILPLKHVNACFGRKSFRESSIDNLHREFYALSDGEIIKVKYPFNADKKNIGEVRAYIENADNLEFAELNGKRLHGFIPSEKDPRFMGIDITNELSDGKNTLALEYRKSNNYTPDFASFTPSHFYSYNITSFEPVYLCGDFDATEDSLIKAQEYENDITKSGMQYYYGPLTYAARLPDTDLSETILAIHGSFDICRIKIGKRSYTFFSETPMLEVFNLDGGSVAEITIYNTPYNLLRTADKNAHPFGLNSIELCKFSY